MPSVRKENEVLQAHVVSIENPAYRFTDTVYLGFVSVLVAESCFALAST